MEVYITEGQYNKLKESLIDLYKESIELKGSQEEYPGNSEIRTSQLVADKDGNETIDCGPTTQDIAKKQVSQQFDFNRGRHMSGSIY